MKFTASQLEFLMTKLTVSDDFITEAALFKPTRKPIVRKVYPLEECCNVLKKDGNPCSRQGKFDGKCGSHRTDGMRVERVAKVISVEEQCCSLKKNGDRCVIRAKENGMCGRHLMAAPSTPPSSPEFVESEDETGSESEILAAGVAGISM